MNDLDKLRLFEKKHRGQLQREEAEMLGQSQELAREAQAYGQLFQGFDALHLEQFQQQMQGWEAQHRRQQKGPKPRPSFWLQWRAYAAVAAILLLLGPVFWWQLKPQTDTELQALLQPAAATLLRDARDQDANQRNRSRALSYYNAKHYDKAQALLQTCLQTQPKDEELRYFLGASLFQQGQWEEARTTFSGIAQSASFYSQEAEWMLLAIQYHLEEKEACLQSLAKILENPEHQKYRSAQILQQKLLKRD